MEEKVLNGLKDLGYNGPLIQKGNLKTSIEYGSKNIEYTKLVNFLTGKLRVLCNIDEEVNPISGPQDSAAFIMELSSFLKELNCPYKSLTDGHVSDRLQCFSDKKLLLDYLVTELMSARIIQEKMPTKTIELKLRESPEAANLKVIMIDLGISKPPPNITLEMVFQKMKPLFENRVRKAGDELIGKPFFSGFLSEQQWDTLDNIQKELNKEYSLRRQMLLTRLDVTIQSFQWSDRSRGKADYFEQKHKILREQLNPEPKVDISHLIAARADIAIIEKTSSSSVRKNTGTSIHKVIIGQVPDRGGRTNELAPPPPEMPSWQQRIPGPPGGGRGGYGRGGGQNYSRGGGQQSYGGQQGYGGGGQSNYGRGNNSFGNSANSSSGSYGGYKPSFTSLVGDKKPFANFDTSLSSYSSSTRSSSYGSSMDSGSYKSSSKPFDSAGSYDSPNTRRSSYDTNRESGSYSQKRSFAGDNEERGNYGSRTNSGSYGSDSRTSYTAFDSAGSYETNKRAKSYDTYQTNNSTYSEQYVKDNQNNQQYHSRNDSSRGRSNYHRGRGQGNNYR